MSLFDAVDLELQTREVEGKGVTLLPRVAVVTGIVGGLENFEKKRSGSFHFQGFRGGEVGGDLPGKDMGGIIRTVRMEQSYV